MLIRRTLTVILIFAGCWLGACSTPPVTMASVFDLGTIKLTQVTSNSAGMRVEVSATPALASTDMVYRLLYDDAQVWRRYANSRWAATPAQLIQERLRVGLLAALAVSNASSSAGPRNLSVRVLEFSQWFDRPDSSRAVIQVEAQLYQNGILQAQQLMQVEAPAASANAAGGAAALAQAGDELAKRLLGWQDEHKREQVMSSK
ncbi:ABC-type transport auxiliary lipoprotein family protein [Ampullimonas aquatilis]|uniref:ABC-type transport auxiliary lipoprotein family protein n=1 Tax=Ampullimonas aquatilis TaxID=1341549 RepID=UPI003C7515F9